MSADREAAIRERDAIRERAYEWARARGDEQFAIYDYAGSLEAKLAAARERERILVRDAICAKGREAKLRKALRQAVAEIDGSPYAKRAWGWGIAYRIEGWRKLADGEGET